jgi:(1->4)-alpha-D-glucan 1-alpha-D-glucosylmutase
LAALESGELPGLDESGAAKLHVVRTALNLRRDRPERFHGYRALWADGPAAEHAVCFLRTDLVAVATRLPVRLEREGGWRDTTLSLPPGRWTDRLSGNSFHSTIHCGRLLQRYPVALLERS